MGDDAVDHVGRKGPFKGKANGMKSADGKRGYRIDIDKESGQAHINWWTPKEKGSVPFTGGERQAKSIVENGVF